MKSFITSLLICLCGIMASAQSGEVLSNKSIVDLTQAGMSKKTILSKIESSDCKFATDTKSLISLKKSGVDADVIDAMMAKVSGNTTQKTSSTAAAATEKPAVTTSGPSPEPAVHGSGPNSSAAVALLKKEGSGIYYYDDNALHEIDPTVFSQSKSNNWSRHFTYGFGKSTKVMTVSGSEANIQFKSKQPMFYFYFDTEHKSLNSQAPSWFSGVSSPNEFLLVKFDTQVKNARAVTTAAGNAYENAQGIDDKYKRTFKFRKLEKGIYELYFETNLEAGEYGFMYAGANAVYGGASPKVYDFGLK